MPDQYNSEYTGESIDDAVGLVKNNECKIKWGNILSSPSITAQLDLINAFVKRTGDDVMSGNLTVSKSTPLFNAQLSDVSKLTNPSSNSMGGFAIVDSNGINETNRLGGVLSGKTIAGVNFSELVTYNGTTGNESLGIKWDSTNNFYTFAPTPAINDNSTKIATTEWVKSEILANPGVVHASGTEIISGNKTFNGSVVLGYNATATTPLANDNSTRVATTAWVNTVGNGVVHISGTETITGNKTFSGTVNFSSEPTSVTPNSSDNSTKIATTAWVNNCSNVVHIAGAETITGNKTFSGSVSLNGSNLLSGNTSFTGINLGSFTSGTVNCTLSGSHSLYSVHINGATELNFALPAVTATNNLHQILVMLKITGTRPSIDWNTAGTVYFFHGSAPSISDNSNYTVVYEYDCVREAWVCGALYKG